MSRPDPVEYETDDPVCPECGAEGFWVQCIYCQGTGLASCICEGAGGEIVCSERCFERAIEADKNERNKAALEGKPTVHEGELPADISEDDYIHWYMRSYVDGVRIGPKI